MLEIPIVANFRYKKNRLPEYAHPGDAGMDIRADLMEPLQLHPGTIESIPSGLFMALPAPTKDQVWAALVLPRSGLAKRGITVANAPGLIDSGYRGEVCVLLVNNSNETYRIEPGGRIAQMVFQIMPVVSWIQYSQLPESTRSTGGFGSTGVS